MDEKYSMVLDAKKAGLQSHEVKKLGKDHPAQDFVHVWNRLRILNDP